MLLVRYLRRSKSQPQSKLTLTLGMTDFGGSGQPGAVAECELNLPGQISSTTLTSSDLNQLGCSLQASPLRLESADSGFAASSRTTSTNEDITIEKPAPIKINPQVGAKAKSRRRSNPSKHIVRSIIASITNGFSNCSRRKNGTPGGAGGGAAPNTGQRRHSDSEEDSNSADLFEANFKSNTKIRQVVLELKNLAILKVML